MIRLLIETSTDRGMVCFLRDSHVLYHKEFPFGVNNSKTLIPSIQEGLNQLNIQLKELAYIGVGIGPGSYTGIRIGAMTAKSMAYAVKVPLIGICTLQCFVPPQDGQFAVLVDAKIGGAYVILGNKKGQKVEYASGPQVKELGVLVEFLQGIERIVTPDSKNLQGKLSKIYPGATWDWVEVSPDPLHMGKIGDEKLKKGEISFDGHLELLYLRKTQAEIERESR